MKFKKISSKKIAVYLLSVAVIITSVGAVIYQNRSLPSPEQPLANSNPPDTNDTPVDSQPPVNQPTNTNQIKNGNVIDSSIFNSEKFKELKENGISAPADSEAGKKNPFSPN
jgi:hypothetical protein